MIVKTDKKLSQYLAKKIKERFDIGVFEINLSSLIDNWTWQYLSSFNRTTHKGDIKQC